jgi:hypothetical protein
VSVLPSFSSPVQTPVGASATAVAVVTVGVYFLSLWPPFGTLPSGVQAACGTIAATVLGYLAGWLKVVRSPGQAVTLELTDSKLPTLQPDPAPEPAPVQPV